MLKGLIAAAGVVVVLALAGPFALGMLAESNLREQIDAIDASSPAVSTEVRGFERRWFSSDVLVDVMPGEIYRSAFAMDEMLSDIIDGIRAPFVVELAHGPFLTLDGFGIGSYAVRANLDSEAEWVARLENELGVDNLFELRGTAGFGSGFDFEGEVTPFNAVDQDNSLDFSGLDFSGEIDRTAFSLDASAEQLAGQSMLLSFVVDAVDVAVDLDKPDGMPVALGTYELSVDRFAASNPLLGTGRSMAMDGLRFSGFSRLNDTDTLDFGAIYEASAVNAPDMPPFADIEIGLDLRNVNPDAYSQLAAAMNDAAVIADPGLMTAAMQQYAHELFANGLDVAVDPLRFSMDGEQFDGRLEIAFAADAMADLRSIDAMTPEMLMNAVTASLEITASKVLIRELTILSLREQMAVFLTDVPEDEVGQQAAAQADQMLAVLAAQGMLIDDGETYSTSITYANGVATINGAPLPLGAMGLF